jgi:spermidine/putrescine transport system ATP-binding protein
VLLLDEPLAALDQKLRTQMQVELKAIQERLGTTFVFVTHDQGEALLMSDRIAVMSEGRVEQYASAEEIYLRPRTRFVATFVGDCNLFEGRVTELADGVVTVDAGFDCRARVASGNGVARGDRIAVSLRPEHVTVRRGELGSAQEPNRLVGRVTERHFMGSHVQITVTDERGRNVRTLVPQREDASGAEVGDPVTLTWDAGHVTAITSGGNPTGDGKDEGNA